MKINYKVWHWALRLLMATLLLLLCNIVTVLAYELPLPVAHYPLRVDRYRNYVVVQPWDVSGHARHGNTFDIGANKLMDASFTRINFPNTDISQTGYTYPCLKKSTTADAHVNIPNLEAVFGETYTIAFWFYYDGQRTTPSTVVMLPKIKIQVSPSGVLLGSNAGPSYYMLLDKADIDMSAAGWYFIMIRSNKVVDCYPYGAHYSYSDTLKLYNASHMGYDPNTAQLLGTDFVGGVHDIRFYDEVLDENDFWNIFQEDEAVASGDFTTESYIDQCVYAHYPLSSADFKKNVSLFPNRDGTSVSGVSGASDRFGNADSAASFPTANAHIAMPPFWGSYFDDYHVYKNDTPKGFTISYWMNITSNMSTPVGGIEMPFDASDHRTKLFYGRENGQDLLGMQQILDRIGVFRYNDITQNRYPWYLWLYDPLSFRNDPGWYHIVWVQYQDWMRMYVYKPDGEMVCNSYYLEIPQAISTLTDWGLGNNAGGSTSQSLILDDFKIYNWPLNPYEVNGLDELERPPSSPAAKPCSPCLTFDEEVARPLANDDIVIFPNPTRDKATIRMFVNEEEHVLISLVGIDGKVYLKNEVDLITGFNSIQLNNLDMPTGTYFVNVMNSKSLNGSYKLTIVK